MHRELVAMCLVLGVHAGCYDPQVAQSVGGGAGCAAASQYGSLDGQEAEWGHNEFGEVFLKLVGQLAAQDAADYLEVALWDGYAAFANQPVSEGTYEISGPETSLGDCGVCVTLYADVDTVSSRPRQVYQAQRGTVTIASVSGTLSGTLEGVVLRELDENDVVLQTDGCESRLDAVAFSAPIAPGS